MTAFYFNYASRLQPASCKPYFMHECAYARHMQEKTCGVPLRTTCPAGGVVSRCQVLSSGAVEGCGEVGNLLWCCITSLPPAVSPLSL